jgi:hypothetical protein
VISRRDVLKVLGTGAVAISLGRGDLVFAEEEGMHQVHHYQVETIRGRVWDIYAPHYQITQDGALAFPSDVDRSLAYFAPKRWIGFVDLTWMDEVQSSA